VDFSLCRVWATDILQRINNQSSSKLILLDSPPQSDVSYRNIFESNNECFVFEIWNPKKEMNAYDRSEQNF
jgi:hypothetical protein